MVLSLYEGVIKSPRFLTSCKKVKNIYTGQNDIKMKSHERRAEDQNLLLMHL